MTNIDYETIKNCYILLEKHRDKKEILGLISIIENLLDKCNKYGLQEVPINNTLLLNLLLVFNEELYNEKMEYIDYKLSKMRYNFLNDSVAFGTVCKIQSHGSLNNDGYAREFLYLTPYSGIKKHKHIDDIEIYHALSGVIKVNDEYTDSYLVGMDQNHGIDEVNNLSIVETYKIARNKLCDESICKINNEVNKSLVLSLNK